MDKKQIIQTRQLAYKIFEFVKNNPNKKLNKEQFGESTLNPSNDKKVTLGLLRYYMNLTNEEQNEIIANAQLRENEFYHYYNKLEKTINTFFNKEIHEIKDSGSISNDMDLEKFQDINEDDLEVKENKAFALDLERFTDMVQENKLEVNEINKDSRDKQFFIISLLDIATFWRTFTPEHLSLKDFIDYLKAYKLGNEENLIQNEVNLNGKECYIINNEITQEEMTKDSDFAF